MDAIISWGFSWLRSLPLAAAQGLVWAIVAIGVYITFRILNIADMTVDGTVSSGAAVCAVLVGNGVNIWVAMLCAFIVGMLCGLVTGLLHTALGIPAILSGILTQLMLYTFGLIVMGGANKMFPLGKGIISSNVQENYIYIVILLVIVAVIVGLLYWFFGTEFGMALRSTGNNTEMSRAQGINTKATTVIGLVLSNGIIAFAGAILAQYSGFADVNMGRGAIVIGLAAIVIGESLLTKITANFGVRLTFVMIGAIIYWMVYMTVLSFKIPTDYLKMLSALIVALFLGIPYLKKKYFSKKKAAKGVKEDA